MDTSYTPQAADASQHAPIIQSASASTECQTNDSKFAYVLTASILGVIALLVIAVVLLIFAIGISQVDIDPHGLGSRGGRDGFGYYEQYDDDFWPEEPYEDIWM